MKIKRHISFQDERDFARKDILEKENISLKISPLDRYQSDTGYKEKVNLIRSQIVDRNALILDLGGNTAGEAVQLISEGYTIIVADINEQALRVADVRCKKFGLQPPFFLGSDAHELALQDETIDQVIIFEALHHIEDYATSLKELYRVLKPGGKIFLYEPHALNPIRRLTEIRDFFRGTIEKSFYRYQMKKLLVGAGFSDVRIDMNFLNISTVKLQRKKSVGKILKLIHLFLQRYWTSIFGNLSVVARKEGEASGPEHFDFEMFKKICICPITKNKIRFGVDFVEDEKGEYKYPLINGHIPVLIKSDGKRTVKGSE
jgi:ubiquinone/menaquinone biosynthesis C-methylase UbiE